MLVSYHGTPVDENLEIIALSDTSWRITHRRYPPADAHALLAYLEHDGNQFVITLLNPPTLADNLFYSGWLSRRLQVPSALG